MVTCRHLKHSHILILFERRTLHQNYSFGNIFVQISIFSNPFFLTSLKETHALIVDREKNITRKEFRSAHIYIKCVI